jgi:hypothetical protein
MWCIQVVNKCKLQSKPQSIATHTVDNIIEIELIELRCEYTHWNKVTQDKVQGRFSPSVICDTGTHRIYMYLSQVS